MTNHLILWWSWFRSSLIFNHFFCQNPEMTTFGLIKDHSLSFPKNYPETVDSEIQAVHCDLENGGGGDIKAEARSGHEKLHNWAADRVCWWKGNLIRRIIIWCTCHPEIFWLSCLQNAAICFLPLTFQGNLNCLEKPRLVSKHTPDELTLESYYSSLKTGMTSAAELSYWNFPLHGRCRKVWAE